MTDDARRRALEAVAARAAAASHLEPPGGEALLRSVVDAAVVVFGAAGGVDRAPRARHRPPGHPGRGRAAGCGRDRARVRGQHGHRGLRLLDRPAARRERRRAPTRGSTARRPRRPATCPAPSSRSRCSTSRAASACWRSSTAAARARTSCATSTWPRCSRARPRSRSVPAAWNATRPGSCARRWPASDPGRTRMARRTRSWSSPCRSSPGSSTTRRAGACGRSPTRSPAPGRRRPTRSGLVIEILEALARRSARPSPRSFRR